MSDTAPEPTREQWNAVHQACLDTGIADLSLKIDAAMVKLLAEREAAAEGRGYERGAQDERARTYTKPPEPYYLIERNDGSRPLWLKHRGQYGITWTDNSAHADRWEWRLWAEKNLREFYAGQFPGVHLLVTEHLDIERGDHLKEGT